MMVWGMNLPSGFGEFWPSGSFEGLIEPGSCGWYERLKANFREDMPDEQKKLFDDGLGNGASRYMGYAVGKFTKELGTVSRAEYPPFSQIEDHEPPRSFNTAKVYKSLGSLIKLNDRILAVGEALKAIIERLEPGVHQFFPIEIMMPSDKAPSVQYYVLVIGNYCDSFIPKSSKEGSWEVDGPDHYFPAKDRHGMARLAFSRAVFNGAHLWRERRMSSPLTCFSAELIAEITTAGLRIPKHYRMMEV